MHDQTHGINDLRILYKKKKLFQYMQFINIQIFIKNF